MNLTIMFNLLILTVIIHSPNVYGDGEIDSNILQSKIKIMGIVIGDKKVCSSIKDGLQNGKIVKLDPVLSSLSSEILKYDFVNNKCYKVNNNLEVYNRFGLDYIMTPHKDFREYIVNIDDKKEKYIILFSRDYTRDPAGELGVSEGGGVNTLARDGYSFLKPGACKTQWLLDVSHPHASGVADEATSIYQNNGVPYIIDMFSVDKNVNYIIVSNILYEKKSGLESSAVCMYTDKDRDAF